MKTRNRFGVEFDTFVVLQRWPDEAHWAPRVMNEQQLGDMLAMAHYGQDIPEFRIYDADSDGAMQECQLVNDNKPMRFDADDYADMQVRIERIDTREYVGTAFARIDGRV